MKEKESFRISRYKDNNFKEHVSLYKYKDIRKEILDYKFNDKSYYYRAFSNILLNNKNICKILKSYDIIVPVPIHKKRKFQRGYNQAELITKQIAIELNKSGLSKFKSVNILVKNKNTRAQSTLNKIERIENVKNIYEINWKEIEKKQIKNSMKILLFDDIYTTGATANECAKIIKKELNPKKIGILTLAKD